MTVGDCDFTGIPKEHGIYDDGAGHALYRGNTFKNLGGQAIGSPIEDQPFGQYGASNMPFTGRATYVLEDNHAVDTGLDAAARASCGPSSTRGPTAIPPPSSCGGAPPCRSGRSRGSPAAVGWGRTTLAPCARRAAS